MRPLKRIALIMFICAHLGLRPQLLTAQTPDAAPLRVVTKPFAPLVFRENDQWRGFSIELWEEIARRIDIAYEWIEVASVTEQIEAVEKGRADVAIAGISITKEREERIDFSYPYFNSGLQIMTSAQAEGSNALRIISGIMSPIFLQALIGLGLLMLIAAHLIWLVERAQNPQFPRGYWRGLGESLWWAATTVAAGFGDKSPRSPLGRLISVVWMFASVILIANFTAVITTTLTVEGLTGTINGPNDLLGKRVVTLAGSTGAHYLANIRIPALTVTTVDEAFALITQGRADAMVYDSPVLLYYAATEGRGKVRILPGILANESYGIALPSGSPYREPINQAILAMNEDGTYRQLYDRWFGDEPGP